MEKDFYRAFEDEHRGPRGTIKERLKVYLTFIEPFKNVYNKKDLKILDLGCGRGEWLELVGENGFDAIGIDLDEGMLEACKAKNLNVLQEDAINFLKKAKNESYIVVSGFHIAEHLPFNLLQDLVEESLRVLKPGGLLILETPNPENVSVATVNFWLDPTHIRPLPPLLLTFLAEYYGFNRNKILRLQEPKEIMINNEISIKDVFFGVSPDYSIVAQKEAVQDILVLFDKAFSNDYGIDLNRISDLYNSQQKSLLIKIDEQNRAWQNIVGNLTSELNALRMEYTAKEENLNSQISQLTETNNNLNQTISNLTTELNALRMEYTAVLNSESWKITKPLRLAGKFARWFKTGTIAWITFSPQSRPRRVTKKVLIKTREELIKRPKLKSLVKKFLKPFPNLENRLKKVGKEQVLVPNYNHLISKDNQNAIILSPRARQIYNDLKKAMEQVKDENPN